MKDDVWGRLVLNVGGMQGEEEGEIGEGRCLVIY
jgi:hypothetical protein